MKAIIAKARAKDWQTHRMGDLQGVATNSTAQNAVAWGETAAQTYTINDNIVYRHAINNANARAKGVQTIAQRHKRCEPTKRKRASITEQARAYHTAWQGRGLLSLSLSR